MASRTDRFIDGRFSGRVNPKDGYAVVDCKEPRARRVLMTIFVKLRLFTISI